jgi:hypothetical protein
MTSAIEIRVKLDSANEKPVLASCLPICPRMYLIPTRGRSYGMLILLLKAEAAHFVSNHMSNVCTWIRTAAQYLGFVHTFKETWLLVFKHVRFTWACRSPMLGSPT